MAEEKRAKRWKTVVTFVTFAALGVLIYAVRDQIVDTIENFRQVNSLVLLLMIPAQAFNYDAYVRMYRHLFGILGKSIEYWRMMKINFELNFVNNVFLSVGRYGAPKKTAKANSENTTPIRMNTVMSLAV